jgi:hypothetical protein
MCRRPDQALLCRDVGSIEEDVTINLHMGEMTLLTTAKAPEQARQSDSPMVPVVDESEDDEIIPSLRRIIARLQSAIRAITGPKPDEVYFFESLAYVASSLEHLANTIDQLPADMDECRACNEEMWHSLRQLSDSVGRLDGWTTTVVEHQ